MQYIFNASFIKEPLINSSFRRRPESMCLIFLDPSLRWDDENVINQRIIKVIVKKNAEG